MFIQKGDCITTTKLKLSLSLLKFAVIFVAFTGLLIPPMSSFAHEEDGSKAFPHNQKPAIRTAVYMEYIGVNDKWKEAREAEIHYDYYIYQDHHAQERIQKIGYLDLNTKKTTTVKIPVKGIDFDVPLYLKHYDVNHSPGSLSSVIGNRIYDHTSCNPPDNLHMAFVLSEDDSYNAAASYILGAVGLFLGGVSLMTPAGWAVVGITVTKATAGAIATGATVAGIGTGITSLIMEGTDSGKIPMGAALAKVSSKDLTKLVDTHEPLEMWAKTGNGGFVKLQVFAEKTSYADCNEAYEPKEIKLDPTIYKDKKPNPITINPGDSLEYHLQITNTDPRNQQFFVGVDFKKEQVSIKKFEPGRTIKDEIFYDHDDKEPDRTLFSDCKIDKVDQTVFCKELIPSGKSNFKIKIDVNEDAKINELLYDIVSVSGKKFDVKDLEKNPLNTGDIRWKVSPVKIIEKGSKDLVLSSSLHKDSQLTTNYVHQGDLLLYKLKIVNPDEKAKKIFFVTDFYNSQVKIIDYDLGDNVSKCEKHVFNQKARLYCEGEIPSQKSGTLQVDLAVKDTSEINKVIFAETILSKNKVSQFTLSQGHSFSFDAISHLTKPPLIKPKILEEKTPKELCNNKELSQISGPITMEPRDTCVYKITLKNKSPNNIKLDYKISAESTGKTKHDAMFLVNPTGFTNVEIDKGKVSVFKHNKITTSSNIEPGTYQIKLEGKCQYNGWITDELPEDGPCHHTDYVTEFTLDVIVPDPCTENNNDNKGFSFDLPVGWSILFGTAYGQNLLLEDPCPLDERNDDLSDLDPPDSEQLEDSSTPDGPISGNASWVVDWKNYPDTRSTTHFSMPQGNDVSQIYPDFQYTSHDIERSATTHLDIECLVINENTAYFSARPIPGLSPPILLETNFWFSGAIQDNGFSENDSTVDYFWGDWTSQEIAEANCLNEIKPYQVKYSYESGDLTVDSEFLSQVDELK